jgi:glycosyltransferase involved in cell wall biosynthesis
VPESAQSNKKKLSLALIARNEARCLARCLASVRDIADQIVVVDTGSTDNTVEIANSFGAQVSHFAWVDDFAAARNASLDLATGDWILALDADETASPQLAAEIHSFIQGPAAVGRLRIVSEFRLKDQTLRSQSFVSRLFPRGARFEGRIHEQLVCSLPRANLRGELWHDGYMQPGKSERNLKLLLREIEREPSNAYLLYQIALEHSELDRTEEAFSHLGKALTLLKGTEPFAPNVIVDFLYAAMALKDWSSGLELMEKARAALDDFPDFHLVCGLFCMNLVRNDPAKYISWLPRIEQSFQKCLTLGESEKHRSVQGAGSFLAAYNLGTLYHAFGDTARALPLFRSAADQGYEPAATMLRQLRG